MKTSKNRTRHQVPAITLLALVLLPACVQQPRSPEPVPQQQQRIQTPQPEQPPAREAEHIPAAINTVTDKEPLDIVGSGTFIRQLQPIAEASQEPGDGVSLNFVDSEIAEFVKIVLGDLLNLNYSIDNKVGGKITIQTASNIPKEELLALAEEVLSMHNATLTRKGDIYYVAQRSKATSIRNTGTGYGLTVIPLRYIAASEMQELLVPVTSSTGTVQVNHLRNLLLVSGSTPEIESIRDMVRIFDVDWLKGMSVSLYPLRYVEATKAQQEMDNIYNALAAGKKESTLLRIVSIERIQSLLLVSPNAERIRQAQQWLRELDKPSEQSGQQLYVYRVQNAKAVELANVLNQIFASRKNQPEAQQPLETTTLAPQAIPQTIETAEPGSEETPPPAPEQPQQPTTGSGVALPATSDIKIIADDTRNSLVILATASDYAMIEAAIKKLDVIPLQVLIEAQIMEITLEDNLQFGVEWSIRNSLGGRRSSNLALDLGTVGIGAQPPALSYSIVGNSGDVRFALNALSREMEIKVLSSPSLMVLDNQTARIVVGDEIPIPKRQSISNVNPDAPTVNEIEFRNTGVSLTVTPRVTDGGLVTIDIEQEVSNATSTNSSGIDAPTIQKRMIKSTIAVQNDDTIVLGGLINDRGTNNTSGVPIAKDIPIIGNLFRNESIDERRTELIVLLTPRVAHNRGRANKLTEEFNTKLKDLNRIISTEEQ